EYRYEQGFLVACQLAWLRRKLQVYDRLHLVAEIFAQLLNPLFGICHESFRHPRLTSRAAAAHLWGTDRAKFGTSEATYAGKRHAGRSAWTPPSCSSDATTARSRARAGLLIPVEGQRPY